MSVSQCIYAVLFCFTVHSTFQTTWEWTKKWGFWPGIYKLHFWDNLIFLYFLPYPLYFVYGRYFRSKWLCSFTLLLLIFISVIGKVCGLLEKVPYRIGIYPPGFGLVGANWFFSSVLVCFGSECWLSIFISDRIRTWLWIYYIYTRSVFRWFWWSRRVCVFIHWQRFRLPYAQSSGLLQSNYFGENSSSTGRSCQLRFFILWQWMLHVNFDCMKWWQKVLVKWTIRFLFTFSEQSLQLKTVTCFKDSHINSHSGKTLCGREASPTSVCTYNMKKEAILQCSGSYNYIKFTGSVR